MAHGTQDRGVTGANAGEPATLDPRRWLALAVLLVAGFMDLLDVTIVNVAVPSIMRDLGAEYSQIEWIVAGYVLGFAALLITGGRLGDIFGRKRVFMLGVAGFTVASALCGLAQDPVVLIAGRFLQGATAGLMVPQVVGGYHRPVVLVGVDVEPGEDGLVEGAACPFAGTLVQCFGVGEQVTEFLDDGLTGGEVDFGGGELFLNAGLLLGELAHLAAELVLGPVGWPTRSR
jgi:hypothetical protein